MRVYTDEERSEAVALVAEHGLAHTWHETGIPKPTLASWADKAGIERTGTQKTQAATDALRARHANLRESLRLTILEKVADLLARMDAPHIEFKGKDADQVEYPIAPAAAVQNYATSVGILIDKYRLEMGEATSRGETKDTTNDLDPDTRRRITTWLDARMDTDARTTDGVPEGTGTAVR